MSIFVDGEVSIDDLMASVKKHATKTSIGAHEIFMGQIRADQLDEGTVVAIEYTADVSVCDSEYVKLREEAFAKWDLTCLHVAHGLGTIAVGSVCFTVFASSPRRVEAREAVAWVVDSIKQRLPIFGKIISEGGQSWKTNQ